MTAIKNKQHLLSVWSGMTPHSKESALELLEREEWSELYISLPRHWEDAIMAIGKGFDFDSVLDEMNELGQVQIPEDAQLVRSWRPFLEHMWDLLGERKVHCLMDPIAFDHHRQISLEMASESVRARLGIRDLERWRELINEEVDLLIKEAEREASFLSSEAEEEPACVDLSAESERRLRERGFRIRRFSTGTADLPLTVLKGEIIEARERGEEAPDKRIDHAIKDHLWFLELLLSSESFEEACLTWGRESRNGS